MASNQRSSQKIAATQMALVALWLAVAVGFSALTIHHAVDVERDSNSLLSGVANGAAHMGWSMGQRGRSAKDIVNAITAMAKTSGVDATATILPEASQESQRPPSPPPGRNLGYVFFMPPPGFESQPGPLNSPALIVRLPGSVITLRPHDNPLLDVLQMYFIVMTGLVLVALIVTWIVLRSAVSRALAPIATIEGSLRRLAEGEYSRLEIVGHDSSEAAIIDAYNAAADELASSIRLRAEAESNLRQFVAEAGHELRTPLTVVMGFVDVLRQGAIAEQALAQRILESVAVEGERMRQLIAKLLLLARLDAVSDRHETIDLSALVSNAVDSLRPLAGSTQLTVQAEPNVEVIGSDSELREVVGNLVDNALKYAPGSNVCASVHRNERFAELTVADDGPGMNAAMRARAFDRFSRGDDRGSVPGSGLGLAIVKRIAVRSGGDVSLDSNPGAGTKVTVRVPLADDQSASSPRSV